MKKLLICIILCTTALLDVSYVNAQQIITLQDAIDKAMEQSKQLKVSDSKLAIFKTKVEQAKNLAIPTINLASGYNRLSNNIAPFNINFGGNMMTLNPQILNQYSNRASLQVPVFNGFKIKNAFESIQYLQKATELDIEKDKLEIKYNIINAYYNVLRAQNTLTILDTSIIHLQKKVEEVENFEANGLALKNDVLKAQMAVNNAKLARIDIINAIETSKYNLALMIGIAGDTKSFELVKDNSMQEKIANDNEYFYTQAINNRSEFKSQQVKLQAQALSIKQSKGNYYPTFSIGANYYLNRPNQREFPQQDHFKNTWDAGAMLSWNLTSLYTTKAQVQEAKENYTSIENTTALLTENVKMEVNANMNTYNTFDQKIKLNQEAVLQATENLRVMNNRFMNNISVTTDVLEAETQLLQANINLLNVNLDSKLAYYKLQKSLGK